MTSWRVCALVGLLFLVGVPLALPFFEFAPYPPRSFFLLLNTLLLVVGTVIIALPLGIVMAVLLYRTDLPFRGLLRFLTLLMLFVPLAVLTTAWHGALMIGGWLPSSLVMEDLGPAWFRQGFVPAIWIHAMAALPWVIVIVGEGLSWVEGELEEEALLVATPARVLWSVTLPRCRATIVAAAMWIALQTATELTVADRMQIRTFAAVVYFEFWLGGPASVARALGESLPFIFAVGGVLAWALPRLHQQVPPLFSRIDRPRRFALGTTRPTWLAAVGALAMVYAGIPLASLLWKVGLHRYPPEWSADHASLWLERVFLKDPLLIPRSLLSASAAGLIIATVALVLSWLAIESRWFRIVLVVLVAVVVTLPGPVIGIGLQETIRLIIALPLQPVKAGLYDGPSPLPVLWAYLLRFLPLAIVMLWPVVRLLPLELRESMRLDGAGPRQELGRLVWPLTARVFLWTAILIAALSLGEIGAIAIRVETPDWWMFSHELLRTMHYSSQNEVYALCLLLLAFVSVTGATVAVGRMLIAATLALGQRFRTRQ